MGVEVDAAALLEVGELGDFEAVEKNLPTDSPGTERGRFPIVFLEADIVGAEINANGAEAAQVEVLDVRGRGLEDHLILKVFVEAIGIFAVAAVGRAAGRLYEGNSIGILAENTEESFGVHGAGADFGVVGLLENAALGVPEVHEFKDQLLKVRPFGFALPSSFTLTFTASPKPLIPCFVAQAFRPDGFQCHGAISPALWKASPLKG